jgi:hypothetical protein
VLVEAGAEVHLAHPLGVKAFVNRRVKTSRRTPPTWPTCCGWAGCPEAWIAPAQICDLREPTK